LIVLSVLLALATDGWRQQRGDRRLEREYLAAISTGLERDTASLRILIEYTEQRDRYARLVLEALESETAITDAAEFLTGVQAAGQISFPTVSSEAYDDLVGSGQLSVIRNTDVRRQAATYYKFVEERQPVYDLWRARIWYDYAPLSISALPLDVQLWATSYLDSSGPQSSEPYSGIVRYDVSFPLPADLAKTAESVATILRANPRTEGSLKAIVRTDLVQAQTLRRQQEMAVALLAAVRAAQVGSGR